MPVLLLAGVLVLPFAGCRTTRLQLISADEVHAVARVRGVQNVVVPYAMTPEMRMWADEIIPEGRPEDRLLALAEALLDSREFRVHYRKNFTGTAEEVFRERQANCLSFTHLFVAMARYVGVPVFFLEVRDIENYSKEGDLVVVSDHIAVGHGPAHELRIIDFAEDAGSQYRQIRPIGDLTAVSLFYSNRGAEHLRVGRLDQSVLWLTDAVRIDPDNSAAWVNLGVALRRSGRAGEARRAYERALEIDPGTVSAYHNLATLLRLQGDDDEAMELMALTDRSSNRNPFSYLALADLNMRHGRLEEAGRFYRKAIRLDTHSAESLAAMGLFELESGDPSRARRWLKKARKLDPEEREGRVLLLALRLDTTDE